MKIITVDCQYVEKEYASAYLLVNNGRGLFIECNTNYAIPKLKAAAEKEGLKPSDIDALIITHVHLDHAGGAGLFMKEFPQAKLYAHPRAARHAIDPSKLVASATQVYGAEFMQRVYGEILPCPENRVVVVNDGDPIPFAGIELQTKWLLGHAKHHLVVVEPTTRTCFTGDSFGVSYPEVNARRGLVILPSTSPTDFDADEAIQSVKWIVSQDFKQVGLTHFGLFRGNDIARAATQLRDQLEIAKSLVAEVRAKKLTLEQTTTKLKLLSFMYFKKQGVDITDEDLKYLKIDFDINAQGLHFAGQKPVTDR